MGVLDGPTVDRVARRYRSRQRVNVLTRCAPQNHENISPEGVTARCYKRQHVVVATAIGMRFVYSNWGNGSLSRGGVPGVDTPGPNDVTIKASFQNVNGDIVPIYFGGKRTAIIEPGGWVISDPVEGQVTRGQVVYTYTYVTVESDGRWPVGIFTDATRNEGYDDSDLTDEGGTPSTTTATQSFGPELALGLRAVEDRPYIGLLGDSIGAAYSESNTILRNSGLMLKALNGAFGTDYCHAQMSLPNGALSIGLPSSVFCRLRLMEGVTDVICQLGRNTVTGKQPSQLAEVQAQFETAWEYCIRRGARVWQTTITPYTTSTDGWLTTANQTPYNAGPAPDQEETRVLVNEWLRTVPAPLSGVFDVTALVESAPNSGLWAANGAANFRTTDGIHLSTPGSLAASAAITATSFGPVAA